MVYAANSLRDLEKAAAGYRNLMFTMYHIPFRKKARAQIELSCDRVTELREALRTA